jgi:2-isopropylmalate synthase
MQREFGPIANDAVDKLGREVSGMELKQMFWREYVERSSPWHLLSFEAESKNGIVKCRAKIIYKGGIPTEITGEGNGPLAALVNGLSNITVVQKYVGERFEIANYSEHALSSGEAAAAISYIQIKTADGKSRWGAGVDTNIELASVKAVLSALNRL